ncbi:MAG TPA: hypothetical protein VGJ45_41500 [Pseudonocardiaceae bacterium]
MCAAQLTEWCRIPTSGARAVAPFDIGGLSLLAVPQLARDIPGEPAHMNGGDPDTDLLILRRNETGYHSFQTVPAPAGEDAEFFRVGDRAFLATASIRAGQAPHDFATESTIYEWTGRNFEPFQRIPTFAAKQWRYFTVAGHHFLALAQGIAVPATEDRNRASRIFRWSGESFEPFQEVPSRWAYNWHAFSFGGNDFLALADHVDPSRLYRWDGSAFVPDQILAEQYGRAFATFHADSEDYLLVGCITGASRLLRRNGCRFAGAQVLDGQGAREFAVLSTGSDIYVVRVNFILGTPAAPITALTSQLYQWQHGKLVTVQEFPTFGGTDVAVTSDEHGPLVIVSNGLSADVRFATDTVVYRFAAQPFRQHDQPGSPR